MRRSRMFAAASIVALGATMVMGPTVATAAAEKKVGGSAYALSVRTELLNAPLVKVDPVPKTVYPQGGDESVVEVGPDVGGGLVTARTLNASSKLTSEAFASGASIAEVTVKEILSAEVVTADCTIGSDGPRGKSSVAKLTVLGEKINVVAEPNTKVDVAGVATVTLNEQVSHGNTLTVNAVHVKIGKAVRGITNADIVLSQAVCTGGTPGTGTSTPTTTTTTTTTTGTNTPPHSGSTTPTTTTTKTGSSSATTSSDVVGIEPAGDDGDLAETGVSDVLPLLLVGAVVLIAGGVGAVLYTRRRRGAGSGSTND